MSLSPVSSLSVASGVLRYLISRVDRMPLAGAPLVSPVANLGHPRLTGKKRGVDSFNVYSRIKGTSAFNLIAAKRVKFPYEDDSPVAKPGTAEEREYQIIGVIADNEVGQPSMIASAVVPG